MSEYHANCQNCGKDADLYELKANGCNIYWLCDRCWNESFDSLTDEEKMENHI